MNESNITSQEAYKTMYLFLEFYLKLGNSQSEDILGLLGDLALISDGKSADPALLDDWNDCLKKVLEYRGKPETGEEPWVFKIRK